MYLASLGADGERFVPAIAEVIQHCLISGRIRPGNLDRKTQELARALGAMGPAAKAAIPVLCQLLTQSPGSGAGFEQTESVCAAIKNIDEASLTAPPTTTLYIDPRYLRYYEQILRKYDANNDGALTEAEWKTMATDPRDADADGNGRITVEELSIWSMKR